MCFSALSGRVLLLACAVGGLCHVYAVVSGLIYWPGIVPTFALQQLGSMKNSQAFKRSWQVRNVAGCCDLPDGVRNLYSTFALQQTERVSMRKLRKVERSSLQKHK